MSGIYIACFASLVLPARIVLFGPSYNSVFLCISTGCVENMSQQNLPCRYFLHNSILIYHCRFHVKSSHIRCSCIQCEKCFSLYARKGTLFAKITTLPVKLLIFQSTRADIICCYVLTIHQSHGHLHR